MKKTILLFGWMLAIVLHVHAQQRIVAECTITYSIEPDSSNADKELVASLKESSKIVYIKGNNSRVDLISPAYIQSTFFDKTNGNAIVLREFGNNKFMTKLDNRAWEKQNKKFDALIMNTSNDTKVILGYECKKAVIQLKDGSVYHLFFATAIAPSVKEYEYEFKNVPGLVLEYDITDKDGKKIHFSATKINLSPVSSSKFDIQLSQYRMMD
ncbi:hypothetical protein GALL_45910 [mine drainage metagenome]|uniref:GLPGLI family protein n=1 Tax=mine drainage metagenome TaxID=410659 RepID=A0A1J5T1U5_9ZZZZ